MMMSVLRDLGSLLTSRRFLVMLAGIFGPMIAKKTGVDVGHAAQDIIAGGAAAWTIAESIRRHGGTKPPAVGGGVKPWAEPPAGAPGA